MQKEKDLYSLLKDVLPNDHSRQSSAVDTLKELMADGFSPKAILDLGCGDGRSIDLFSEILPNASWTGVDIESSPEVDLRTRQDGNFKTYNGTELPFDNESFDVIYSYQVMEHVRHPEKVLNEISRTLSDDGFFVGQTSQFEPYHSFSYWNFTVWGFKQLCESSNLQIVKFRPGIDGKTLIDRRLNNRAKRFSKFFNEESPLNEDIEKNTKKSAQVRNFRKLIYAGQFCFIAKKM